MTKYKLAYYMATPTRCRAQAADLGPDVTQVVEALLMTETSAHLRQVLGLLRLAETYGAARLDAACHRAVAYGDPRYQTVRTILLKAWDQQPLPPQPDPPACPPAGALLRGPSQFSTPAPDDAAPR